MATTAGTNEPVTKTAAAGLGKSGNDQTAVTNSNWCCQKRDGRVGQQQR